MTRKPITYPVLILDRSGSMASVRDRTVSDINEKVQMYRNEAKLGEQTIKACFLSFNEHLDEHLWLEDAEKLQTVTNDDYKPDGGTALNDAIVYTLTKLQETVKLEDEDAIWVTIITDGEENSSKLHPRPKGDIFVKQLIKRLEAITNSKGQPQWTINYIGANQDVEEVAERYGITHANCAVYSTKNAQTVGAAHNYYNARSQAFLRARTKGVTASRNLVSDVDGQVADLTNLPPEVQNAANS